MWFTAFGKTFYLSKRSAKKAGHYAYVCPNSRTCKCHYLALLSYKNGTEPDWNDYDAYRRSNWTVEENSDVQQHTKMPKDGDVLAKDYRKTKEGDKCCIVAPELIFVKYLRNDNLAESLSLRLYFS